MAVSRGVLAVLFVVIAGSMFQSAQAVSTEEEFDSWVATLGAKYAAVTAAAATTGDLVTVAATPEAAPTCVRYVAKSGADYKKVKSAVNSIPKDNNERCVIYVAAGTYE